MRDLFEHRPTGTAYRAQFIERNGYEPKWVPTRYAKVGRSWTRVWAHNMHYAGGRRDYE